MDSEQTALTRRSKEPGFWREMWQHSRLVVRLMADREVPFYLKFLPAAALGYVLFPFDLLPDLAPVVGQLDDLTALLVSSKVFIELAPQSVVAKHLQAIREKDGYTSITELVEPKSADDDLADAIIIDPGHEIIPPDAHES